MDIGLPTHDPNVSITPANAEYVMFLTHKVLRDSPKVLCTDMVGRGVVVIYRDPQTNTVGMAHISTADQLVQLEHMYAEMHEEGKKLQATLWGGRVHNSETLVGMVMKKIATQKDVDIVAMDVCNPEREKPGAKGAIAATCDGRLRIEQSETMMKLTDKARTGRLMN